MTGYQPQQKDVDWFLIAAELAFTLSGVLPDDHTEFAKSFIRLQAARDSVDFDAFSNSEPAAVHRLCHAALDERLPLIVPAVERLMDEAWVWLAEVDAAGRSASERPA